MFKHLLKVALRQLFKQRFYAFINLFCLILGLTSTIIILLYCIRELSFDKQYINRKNISCIISQEEIYKNSRSFIDLGPKLKSRFPEIERMTRVSRSAGDVIVSDNRIESRIYFVDPDFNDMFKRKNETYVSTNFVGSLYNIFITENLAEKIFGSNTPDNNDIIIDIEGNEYAFKISSVIEDFGNKSSLDCDIICSFDFYIANLCNAPLRRFFPIYTTFIELTDGTSKTDLEVKINGSLNDYDPSQMIRRYELHQFDQLYLNSANIANYTFPTGDKRIFNVLIIVAILIFLSFNFNYNILLASGSITKYNELNIRSFCGASESQIKYILFIDSFLLFLISLPFSLIISKYALPIINSLFNTDITIISVFQDYTFLYILIAIIISISSSFLYLTRFYSNQKRDSSRKKYSREQNILLVIQMFIFICLINTSLFIYKQINYSLKVAMPKDSSGILFCYVNNLNNDNIIDLSKLDLITEMLLSSPYILNSSYCSESFPFGDITSSGGSIRKLNSSEIKEIASVSVGKNFPEMMDYKLISGNYFTGKHPKNQIIINEAAVEYIQLDNPVGTIIEQDGGNAEIVGIVENFVYQSSRKEILPLKIMPTEYFRHDFFLVSKIKKTDKDEVIKHINNVLPNILVNPTLTYSTYNENIESLYLDEKNYMRIVNTGAIISSLIAFLGLLAVSSFSVKLRTKEISIRKINGALVKDILVMINKSYLIWVLLSFVSSIPVVHFFVSKWLEYYAFKTELNWWVFLFGGFLACLITVITITCQSFKVAMKNPVDSLRYE